MSARELQILNGLNSQSAKRVFNATEFPEESLSDLLEEFELPLYANCFCGSKGEIECPIHTAKYGRSEK